MKQLIKENTKPKTSYKKTRNDKENESTPSLSDMPVLSDSLLRRIQNKQSIPPQSLHPNVPTLPVLSRQPSNLDSKSTHSSLKSPLVSNSLKLKTSMSNIALTNSINTLNNKLINSARFLANKSASQQSHLKKLNKTKFSAFNNFQLNELTSSSSSFNSSGSSENNQTLEDLFENGNFNKDKFNEKFHGSSTQSNLLKKLRMNDNENPKTEIFVRPIPLKTNKSTEEKQSKHKVQPININLAPLIKNFRLSSFDFQKFNAANKNNEMLVQIPANNIEFNIEAAKPKTFEFNFKPFKPVLSKPSSPILANFEITAHPNNSLKPIDQNLLQNKSINYLANGLFDSDSSSNAVFPFKSSSYMSLNRKLDLDDIEYYDFNELFRNNNMSYWKTDNQRKKLSQINEESTVSNTPMSDSRWSSSLSTDSNENQKMEDVNSQDEQSKEELWSANNSSTSAHTSNTNQYGRPVRRNSRPMLNPVF